MSWALRGRWEAAAPVGDSQHQAFGPTLAPGPRLRRSYSWPLGRASEAESPRTGHCVGRTLAEVRLN